MNAGTLQNYRKNQKKQGNNGRRKQAKRDINQALDARATEFTDTARKLNELYTRFAATSDADGFARAVLDYVDKDVLLMDHVKKFQEIIDGHRNSHRSLQISGDDHAMTPQQFEEQKPNEIARKEHEYTQKRLEAMNNAFQKLLKQLI